MNRIDLVAENINSTLSPTNYDNLHDMISTRDRLERAYDVPYATFAPIHYEEGYAYPLLVWLHGSASTERELRQAMPHISMRNFVAVAPRGVCESEFTSGRFGWRQTESAIDDAQNRINDCITLAQDRFNIHPDRIFLAGHGSGATMALRTAWNDPGKFAGVVAINGPLPSRLSPMRRVNELRRVPCLLTTSRDSRAYPADQVCQDLRLLHSAGCLVSLRQYPGGDSLTNSMLADVNRWVMERVCGSKA